MSDEDDEDSKWVNDAIHGHIKLSGNMLQYVDTPQFQRLRQLQQLGSASYVFIGATHTRFEHSIGTAHLAKRLLTHLNQKSPIDDYDYQCVTTAALLHDIGHASFSHVFDGEFLPRSKLGHLNWTHEQGSEMMFQSIVDDGSVDLDTDTVRYIKSLIQGVPYKSTNKFLYEVVANKRNGIDVDKQDYLVRDAYNLGMHSSYDCTRLTINSKVIDDQICWNSKEMYNVYDLFCTRFSLHRRVYSHRVSKAIELMMVDALLLADDTLNISSSILNPADFLQMTDGIIRDIEKSKQPELEAARQLIWRLKKRYLYKFVDEVRISSEQSDRLFRYKDKSEVITPAAIRLYDTSLSESDIIVSFMAINYGMKDKNPVDRVGFFNKYKPNELFQVSREEVSHLLPNSFQELTLRVFCRNPEKVPQVQAAFRKYIEYLYKENQIVCDSGSASPMKLIYQVPAQHEWNHIVDSRAWSPRKAKGLFEEHVVKSFEDRMQE